VRVVLEAAAISAGRRCVTHFFRTADPFSRHCSSCLPAYQHTSLLISCIEGFTHGGHRGVMKMMPLVRFKLAAVPVHGAASRYGPCTMPICSHQCQPAPSLSELGASLQGEACLPVMCFSSLRSHPFALWSKAGLSAGADCVAGTLGSKMSQESLTSESSLVVLRKAPFSGALRMEEALDWRDTTERLCMIVGIFRTQYRPRIKALIPHLDSELKDVPGVLNEILADSLAQSALLWYTAHRTGIGLAQRH